MAEFCTDQELGYERSRTRFVEGEGLALDASYRLAHLPLIAPSHPRVIPSRDGTYYSMGHHPPVFSLVLPISSEMLNRSNAYQELAEELRHAPFAAKIEWSIVERRQSKLHATICGSLAVGNDPPALTKLRLERIAEFGRIQVELRGIFSGNINVGRLYLRVYSERQDGENVIRRLQRLLGRPETDLYVVGIWNFRDDLNASEAAALRALLDRWWNRSILQFEADQLWLLSAADDLAMSSSIVKTVSLV